MFDVSISLESHEILGEFVVDSYFFEPSKYVYAFYLYKDNERVDFVWYTRSMKASFDLKYLVGVFFIKVFIKDVGDGSVRTYDSEKLPVNI